MKIAQTLPRPQHGFSLVELMVAVTIGLIILAAVSGIFVTSKSTYNTTDSLARLQENARFAVHYISRDIRNAGYNSCLTDLTTINSTVDGADNTSTAVQVIIEGLENASGGTGTWKPSGSAAGALSIATGTDALRLRIAEIPGNISIREGMPPTSSTLKVTTVDGLAKGDIIMITDCSSADIMQLTDTPNASSLTIQHNPGQGAGLPQPGNTTQALSKQYNPPTQVIKFSTVTYFVTVRATDGVPVLMKIENGNPAVELIEGVENMQIQYGKDTDATLDGIPNVYLKAGDAGLQTSDDWSRVQTIRIGLLMRTVAGREEYTTAFNDSVLDQSLSISADRHHRKVFTFTVQARNMFPGSVAVR